MLASMTGQQLLEWSVYAEKEPFGEERADLRIAILTAQITNLWRGEDDPVRKPEEFMPKFEPLSLDPFPSIGEHDLEKEENEEDVDVEKKINVAMKLDAYFSALAAAGKK
jgi:hypothetical protein